MPFLDRLGHWARAHPQAAAMEVGRDRLSFAGLSERATDRLPATAALSVLCEPNGTNLAAALAAGVAGRRRVAVLDPGWPPAHRAAVEQRMRALSSPARDLAPDLGSELRDSSELTDGPGDSVFLYGLTSGTSALPKAFARTRRSWRASFELSAPFFALTRHDRTLAPGPLSGSLTLYALAESLYAGAAFVTLPRFDVGGALASIGDRGITRLVAVPTMLRMLAERGLAAGVDGGTLTGIVSAGARLDPATLEVARRWAPQATVFAYYGAAELGFVAATVLHPGDTRPGPASAVGPAFPGVELRVVDEAGGRVPAGTPGTIAVRSPFVSSGYVWGDDGHAFRRDGDWCTVGDRGFVDPAGVLHYLDRRADMIVTAGQNVYPQEVEAVLETVAGVQAVVVGLPDDHRGTRIVAAVLATAETDAAGLRRAAAVLADGKRPRAYYRVSALPLSAAGKLSRPLLAAWIADGDDRVAVLD